MYQLTDEEKYFIECSIESGKGRTREVLTGMKKHFGLEEIERDICDAIEDYRADYVRRRLGTGYYSWPKLRCFQLFESGSDDAEASRITGLTVGSIRNYRSIFQAIGIFKAREPRNTFRGVHIGSGCMFSRYTRRDTIWKQE